MQRKMLLFTVLALAAILVAGCADLGPQATPVPPTKTPKPTFTATPDWTPTPVVFATATPEPPTATPEPEFTATPEATPTETPNPTARLTANQAVNVRSGPGTNYTTIGSLSAGQTFEITGKNPAGDWLEFQFDGRQGWVKSSLVTVSGDMNTVQVAQNIPAAPTARPTARPQATATPAPTAAPAKRYEFNIALVQACEPQAAGNWFSGTVYKNGTAYNGARVVFSYAADGPWVTEPQISGPHTGYTNWAAGYYSHIIRASEPQAGDWYVWIVNDGGSRISEIAHWRSTGPGDGCNQATVDFDSR